VAFHFFGTGICGEDRINPYPLTGALLASVHRVTMPCATLLRRTTVCRLGILPLLVAVTAVPGCGQAGLEFFPATYDREAYAKQPDRYDRITLPPGAPEHEAFVARVPPLMSIPLADVQSVSARRWQSAPELEGLRQELLRQHPERRVPSDIVHEDFNVIFTLTEHGAKVLWEFVRNHQGELLDLKFEGQHLTLVSVREPASEAERDLIIGPIPKSAVDQLRTKYPQLKME